MQSDAPSIPMTTTEIALAYELLAGVVGLEVEVLSKQTSEISEGQLVLQAEWKIDEDDVEPFAFGILFALGVLSFHEARPAGYSEIDYENEDEFGIADFLGHVLFRRGALELETDYLRGRRMKTYVSIHQDGRIAVQTIGRDLAAERWLMTLQGKRPLHLVRTPPPEE